MTDLVQIRTTITDTPSGKVEMVFNGLYSTLQFNCGCTDALPYCNASCCRVRAGYTVILQPDEVGKFVSQPHPQQEGKFILAVKPNDYSCHYLGPDSRCTIHNDKPWACRAWHCSPDGVGENLEMKDGGWFLSPLHGNLQDTQVKKDG